jgi:muconate cycloisomerase
VVNVKVGKLGGLVGARKTVAIAESAGMGCMVGCMLEGGVGMLAGAHLAAALPGITHASELVGSLLYRRDLLDISERYAHGTLRVPGEPGLGFRAEQVDWRDA